MQSDNRFLDDLARLASGTLSTLQGAKNEATARFRDQIDRLLGELDLVAREDFEAVKAMAAKARKENEALVARVAALEAALGKSAKAATGARKTKAAGGAGKAKRKPAAKTKRKPAAKAAKRATPKTKA